MALTLLSAEAVAGFGITGTTGVRYIERQTGHVFDVSPQGETKLRISNTTIPKVFDALWAQGAARAILKYFEGDALRVVAATFSASSTQAIPLSSLLLDSAFSPAGAEFAYLLPSGDGADLITAKADNTGQRRIANFAFQDFALLWPTNDTFALVNRPSGVAEGFYFAYNTRTGALIKRLGGVLGLEIKLSPAGRSFVYSSYNEQNRKPELFFAPETGTPQNLSVAAMASQCAFSRRDADIIYCANDSNPPRGIYPDEWLQGVIELRDLIWKINTKTRENVILPVGRFFDIEKLEISDDDAFLYFMEKENHSLWSYALTE